MARSFALLLAGLLVAAVVLRSVRPAAPPRGAGERVVSQETAAIPEPMSAPVPKEPPPLPRPSVFVEPVLTADELLPLARARFPDETILAFARVSGRAFRPTSEELLALRQAGMSDAVIGQLMGVPAPAPASTEATGAVAPPPVYVQPTIAVYSPVTVTVVEAPPPPAEPFVSAVLLVCATHGRAQCCAPPDLSRPPIYQKPPFFKTHAYMPTKRSPTADDVARRDAARASRINR